MSWMNFWIRCHCDDSYSYQKPYSFLQWSFCVVKRMPITCVSLLTRIRSAPDSIALRKDVQTATERVIDVGNRRWHFARRPWTLGPRSSRWGRPWRAGTTRLILGSWRRCKSDIGGRTGRCTSPDSLPRFPRSRCRIWGRGARRGTWGIPWRMLFLGGARRPLRGWTRKPPSVDAESRVRLFDSLREIHVSMWTVSFLPVLSQQKRVDSFFLPMEFDRRGKVRKKTQLDSRSANSFVRWWLMDKAVDRFDWRVSLSKERNEEFGDDSLHNYVRKFHFSQVQKKFHTRRRCISICYDDICSPFPIS